MSSPLDPSRRAPSPERDLRVAVVAFAGGAVVPALTCFPLSRMVFHDNPAAVWVTLLTTVGFAYAVVRLTRLLARVPRPVSVFGLSILGGMVNGATAGALSGLPSSHAQDPSGLAAWGGTFGLVFGVLFGIANALLVDIASRGARSPSTMSAGRTSLRLAATVGALVAFALAVAAADHEAIMGDMHVSDGPQRWSLPLAFLVPVAVTLLATTLALTRSYAQSVRRRWLDRVRSGQDVRYRVLPFEAAPVDSSLALFDGSVEDERADVIVRVDVVDEAHGGAYRHAEHLTPVARLSR